MKFGNSQSRAALTCSCPFLYLGSSNFIPIPGTEGLQTAGTASLTSSSSTETDLISATSKKTNSIG